MSSSPSARSCSSPSASWRWSPSCSRCCSPARSPSRSGGSPRAAERVRRGINKRVEIPDFTQRRDEIGHLSGALRDMTTALYNRIEAIEAFAADVSHELKNPLTSLRSAVETLPFAKNEDQRDHLVEIVKDDVRRLDRLITDISGCLAARCGTRALRGAARSISAKLLETLVSFANEIAQGPIRRRSSSNCSRRPRRSSATRPSWSSGHDNRLGQVVRNLIDNARSFTPAKYDHPRAGAARAATMSSSASRMRARAFRPDNLERIFERFYTDRPEGCFGKNSGLGLSISQQIVEAHKGRIWAENRYGKAPQGRASGRSWVRASSCAFRHFPKTGRRRTNREPT